MTECKTDCHETRGRNTGYFAKNIRPSFAWVVFFRSQKADITFVAGRKRKQVFMTRFGALCIKTDCQNPPPWCLFSSKALLCCLGNQHTRPVLMTGTPGIWSYCCYLSLLNTNQGIARVHPTLCLYKALNYFFFPLVRLSGNAWHSVSGAPCSNGWCPFQSFIFRWCRWKHCPKLEDHCVPPVISWKIN